MEGDGASALAEQASQALPSREVAQIRYGWCLTCIQA